MRYIGLVASIAVFAWTATASFATDASVFLAQCREMQDEDQRLKCYDGIPLAEEEGAGGERLSASPVAFESAVLRNRKEDIRNRVYSPRIELVPRFTNNSSKDVVGIIHKFSVIDAFGDIIVEQEDKLDISIPAGQSVQSTMYYFWEDNQFIHSEPYDRLLGPVTNDTASVMSQVLRVVYADGSIDSF